MIYFDNAATAKPNDKALARASAFLSENYYNPSALYKEGFALQTEIKSAREKILSFVADPHVFELIFTSGGTESDNTAIFGYARRGNAVTTAGEHSAVTESFKELKNRNLAETRIAPLKSCGRVDEEALLSLVDDKTSFVSVMHVNNETGAINDVVRLARLVKQKNPRVVFHCDGVQGYGKIPFRLTPDIDLYSISAHKIGGVKGIGGLIRKKTLAFHPFVFGGGQESGKRSGTENVYAIKVFEYAAEEKFRTLSDDYKRLSEYKALLCELLDKEIFRVLSGDRSSPYITSVSACGLRGEVLLHVLDDRGVIVGTGSACSTNSKTRFSRVILACGHDEKTADGVLRLSFSPETTLKEIEQGAFVLNEAANELKKRTGV